jgi:peptidoglycan/LPS O-acetylase OafA/YrhL
MKQRFDNYLDINKDRIIGLDILRAMAIFLVLYLHGILIVPKEFFKAYLYPCLIVDGVSIFFVLSGYLIGGILIKIINTTNFTISDLYQFWIRRWFRTLPTYYFVLLVYFLFLFITTNSFSFFNFSYIFFYQNFISSDTSVFPEIWSLCIEEWFYLLFPTSIYFLIRILKNKRAALIISILIFVIVPLVLRIIKFNAGIGLEDFNQNYRKIIVLRIDSLIYGIIGAYIKFYYYDIWIRYKKQFLFSGILMVILIFTYKELGTGKLWFNTVINTSLDSISTMLMLPFLSELKTIRSRYLTGFFTFFSITSYSLYLLNLSPLQTMWLHYLLPKLGMQNINWGYKYFIYWSITMYVSYLLNKYIEKPSTDLRDRFSTK